MKQLIIISVSAILTLPYFASSQPILNKKYLDAGVVSEIIPSTNSNGYLFISNVGSLGNDTSTIYRVNLVGDTIWTRSFSQCKITDVALGPNPGYIVMGNDVNGVLMGIDDSGNLLWAKEYDVGGFLSFSKNDNNDIYVVAENNLLLKINSVGDTLWVKEFMDSVPNPFQNYSNFYIDRVLATSDGGCLISGGHSDDFGDYLDLFFKVSTNGNVEWSTEYYLAPFDQANITNIWGTEETDNGDYLFWFLADDEMSTYLVKLNNTGQLVWDKAIMCPDLPFEACIDVLPTTSDNLILGMTGFADPPSSVSNVLNVYKFDANGDTLWVSTINNIGVYSPMEYLHITELNNNYVFINQDFGNNWMDVSLIDVTTNGDSECDQLNFNHNIQPSAFIEYTNPPIDITQNTTFTIIPYNYQMISISVELDAMCSPNSNGIDELFGTDKQLVKITDLMGRETTDKSNTTLIYIYSDGTTDKVYRME